MTLKRKGVLLAGLVVAAFALVAAGCGGGGGGGAPEALPSSSCTGIEYKGDGDPDYIVASDFPLQGSSRTQTEQIVAAIRYELDQRSWKAGDYNIGFQSCDDATAQAGKWDSGKCSLERERVRRERQGDRRHRHLQLRLRGDRDPGPEPGAGRRHRDDLAGEHVPVPDGEPAGRVRFDRARQVLPVGDAQLRPRRRRTTTYQGAAVAEFMQAQGVKSVYILNDKEAYGLGVATTTRKAAESLGIKIAGFEAWDPKATSYTSQFQKIKATGADAVFLGGLIDENGAQVIKDKVAVLGPNDGAVKLLAPDGFTTQATIDESGPASKGMFMSVAGVPIDQFKGAALDFIDGLQKGPLQGKAIDPYAIYGGQAGQVLLDAIAASDGTRSDVIAKMFDTTVTDGLLGSFKIDENGDPEEASGAVVGFTIYRATDELTTETTVSPKPETVAAAGGQ